MDEKLLNCPHDIKLAVEEVDSNFHDKQRTFQVYQRDIILLGEIAKNL